MTQPAIVPAGDQALRIVFENKIEPKINLEVNLLDERIMQKQLPGIKETIPAFRTLTVLFDGLLTDFETLSNEIEHLFSDLDQTIHNTKRIIEIPVCYDIEFGIDLKDVAEHGGLTTEQVIQIHTERDYLIYMLGFLPGFPYLGGMNPILSMPRLETPRFNIKEGAVGIAGNQTGIYPMDSPGGWRIIGSTPIKLFDVERESPFLYEAGDYIRFKPVSRQDYDEISKQVLINEYQCNVVVEDDELGNNDNE